MMLRCHGDEAATRKVKDQFRGASEVMFRRSEEQPCGDRSLVSRITGAREDKLAADRNSRKEANSS